MGVSGGHVITVLAGGYRALGEQPLIPERLLRLKVTLLLSMKMSCRQRTELRAERQFVVHFSPTEGLFLCFYGCARVSIFSLSAVLMGLDT